MLLPSGGGFLPLALPHHRKDAEVNHGTRFRCPARARHRPFRHASGRSPSPAQRFREPTIQVSAPPPPLSKLTKLAKARALVKRAQPIKGISGSLTLTPRVPYVVNKAHLNCDFSEWVNLGSDFISGTSSLGSYLCVYIEGAATVNKPHVSSK
jgi:hypothetical protein